MSHMQAKMHKLKELLWLNMASMTIRRVVTLALKQFKLKAKHTLLL